MPSEYPGFGTLTNAFSGVKSLDNHRLIVLIEARGFNSLCAFDKFG